MMNEIFPGNKSIQLFFTYFIIILISKTKKKKTFTITTTTCETTRSI